MVLVLRLMGLGDKRVERIKDTIKECDCESLG